MTAPTAARSRRRIAGIASLLLVLVGVAVWLLYASPSARWGRWMHRANERETRARLSREEDPKVLDALEAGLRDDDLPRVARVAIGSILIERNRIGAVERAAMDPSLDVRTVGLDVLARQSFFQAQYRSNPDFPFDRTILEWLGDARRGDRGSALQLLPQLHPIGEALPDPVRDALRALLDSSAEDGALRTGAATALAGYKDCASADRIAALALSEASPLARLRLLQATAGLAEAGVPACASALPKERVEALLAAALAHRGDAGPDRSLRMGALGVLARHPEWAAGRLEAARAILDSGAHEVERRAALEALAQAEDATTKERLPAYLHDADAGVRSTASAIVRQERPDGPLKLSLTALNALLSGYVSSETEGKAYEAPLRLAYAVLRHRAGAWVGLPEPFRSRSGAIDVPMAENLHELFTTGAFEGTTRAQVGEALFRWVATDARLDAAAIETAVAARASFWAKARAGDVPGATSVYDASSSPRPDVWAYERAWLTSRRRP